MNVKKFKKFYFERFEFDESILQASFYYSFDREEFFEEHISFFSEDISVRKNIDREIFENILFHLHIALGMSYYKLYPTKELIVETGKGDEYQQQFWKKFYLNGLGEFFYRNDFDPSEVANFYFSGQRIFHKKDFGVADKNLVAIGGGKDSIVSIELLNEIKESFDIVTFATKDNILYKNTQEISGKKRLFLQRIFGDYSHLVAQGYYNGHVAITGMIAFVLEASAYLYEYKNIVLSNEKSANFGNIFWKKIEVNHQYSKSLEFEKDFGEYVEKYISSDVKYFSLLRPFYEIKIAQIFAKYGEKYFKDFSSCNTNFKIFQEKFHKNHTGYWCLECPKCVFVYTILRPFLTKNQTIDIFSKELYDDVGLEKLFSELLGISGIKPFECVGTNEEMIFAMKMSLDNWEGELPYILKKFEPYLAFLNDTKTYKDLYQKLFACDFENSFIPEKLKKSLINIL